MFVCLNERIITELVHKHLPHPRKVYSRAKEAAFQDQREVVFPTIIQCVSGR